jgi:monoamine oxidase
MGSAEAGGMARRTFLAGAFAGTGTLVLGRGPMVKALAITTSPRPEPATRGRVVIVGAGLAGLTAAVDLHDAGWEVVVLEARERVGGRVHTLWEPYSEGLHAEAGGESIDDNHHHLLALVRRFGLQTESRPPDKLTRAVVYRHGNRNPLSELITHRGGAVAADYVRFSDALARLSQAIDPHFPERAPNALELDRHSLEDFIRGQRLVPGAEFLVRLQNRAEYNAEARELSLLFVAQQTVVVADVPPSAVETMRIAGGNVRLPRALASALGDRVRLGCPVSRVEHGPYGVRVHSRGRPVDAAHVVLALPMSPLRQVRFDPTLPPSVVAVIEGLDLGAAVKVSHEYAAPFWRAGGASGFTVTDLPFAVAWDATDSYRAPGGILTQFITGDAARAAARSSDAARTIAFRSQLERVYPEGRPYRTWHTATMAWANEPYTGGGYALFRPGQLVPFWPVLRDGLERIHFAGEHVATMTGYMESAVRSGHRVAEHLGKPASRRTTRSGSP